MHKLIITEVLLYMDLFLHISQCFTSNLLSVINNKVQDTYTEITRAPFSLYSVIIHELHGFVKYDQI